MLMERKFGSFVAPIETVLGGATTAFGGDSGSTTGELGNSCDGGIFGVLLWICVCLELAKNQTCF